MKAETLLIAVFGAVLLVIAFSRSTPAARTAFNGNVAGGQNETGNPVSSSNNPNNKPGGANHPLSPSAPPYAG
jgi:hypothetical protein